MPCALPAARLALGLCLALGGLPAAARDLSGRLVSPGPADLPAGAAVIIAIEKADGTRADLELPTGGAQPPLPFRLTLPDTAMSLRLSIVAEGETLWVAAPVEIAAGANPVVLGEIALTSYRAFPLTAVMACGDEFLRMGLAEDRLRLVRGEAERLLFQVPSGSGTLHADDTGTEVHGKGDRALVTWQGEALPECRTLATPETAEIRAGGNEPGWTLTIGPKGVAYASQAGETVAMEGAPALRLTEDGHLAYAVEKVMSVTLRPGPCRDSMTGMPHPLAVAVDWAGERLEGCGGDPAALLAGAWSITGLGGDPLPEGVVATMDFAGGRLSGYGGCNDYSADVTLDAERLTFGPVLATKMACPEFASYAEADLFATLARVTGFDVAGDEASFLAGDVPVLMARRRGD